MLSTIAADDDDDDDDGEDDDDDIFGAGGVWYIDISGWLLCDNCEALGRFAAFSVLRFHLISSGPNDCLRFLLLCLHVTGFTIFEICNFLRRSLIQYFFVTKDVGTLSEIWFPIVGIVWWSFEVLLWLKLLYNSS